MTITKTEEFKQTEIGEIPQTWEITPIMHLVVDTETVNPAKEPDKEVRYIDVSAVSNKSFRVIAPASYKGANAPGRARKLVKKGDVIVATVRPTLKRIAFIPKELDGQIASTAFCVLRANPKVVSERYLYQRILCSDFTEALGKIQSGASYPAVTDKDVLAQLISIPKDIKEQEKIAFVLSEIQKAVEIQEKIVANLKELKAATMAKLFREGTRGEPLKQTEIGEMPESWQIRKLGTLATFQGGFAFKSMDYQKDGIRLFKISNVSFGKVLWDDVSFLPIEYLKQHKEYFLNRGDIVLAMTRPIVTGGIKVARLLEVDMPCLLNQRVGRFILGDKICPDFIYHFLFTKTFTKHIVSGAEGAQQPNISANKIEQALVPYPPDAKEQQEIADILSAIDSKIALQVDKYANLSEMFQSSLNLLMTGKKRVKDLNIAEALANAR